MAELHTVTVVTAPACMECLRNVAGPAAAAALRRVDVVPVGPRWGCGDGQLAPAEDDEEEDARGQLGLQSSPRKI